MKFSRLAILLCLLLAPQQAASAEESINIASGEYRPWTSEHLRSDPVFPSSNAFFHLKDSPFNWETMDDLKDIKIGATLEYIYGDDFAAAAKAGLIHPEYVASDELNLKKLQKGRIDVFVGNVLVTYTQIRDNFSELEALNFTHHPKVLSSIDLHLILSKANPDSKQLIDLFNDGLQQLRDSGRYDKITSDALAGKYEKVR